jgi:hypothetical protein
LDSIPAAFAVTRDPAVIWTSNAFALLGLGKVLALVDILVRRLHYLDKTIAVILAFVGAKILADDVVHVGDLASLGVIVGLLGGGVAASLVADRLQPPHPVEERAGARPAVPSSSGRFLPGPGRRRWLSGERSLRPTRRVQRDRYRSSLRLLEFEAAGGILGDGDGTDFRERTSAA